MPISLRRALTLLLVVVGWVLFRSESFDQAVRVLSGMAGMHGAAGQFSWLLLEKHLPSAFFAAAGLVFWVRYEPGVVGAKPMAERSFGLLTQYLLFGGFLMALLFSLSSRENPFLYFQF